MRFTGEVELVHILLICLSPCLVESVHLAQTKVKFGQYWPKTLLESLAT